MNKANVAKIVVTLAIAVLIGGLILVTAQGHFEERQANMEDRAVEVYGDNYTDGHAEQGNTLRLEIPVPANESRYNATELVEKHMYVTGYSYNVNDLYWQFDLSREEVKDALRELENQGTVDSGYMSRYFLPEKMWIHAEHGSLPDKWYHPYASILPIMGVLMVGVFVIPVLYGYIKRGENDE